MLGGAKHLELFIISTKLGWMNKMIEKLSKLLNNVGSRFQQHITCL